MEKKLYPFKDKLREIGNSRHLLIPAKNIKDNDIDPEQEYEWEITAKEVEA